MMRLTLLPALILSSLLADLRAAEPVTRVGAGSYANALPPGAKGPPETIYRTENAKGPMPTNDWWSSLAWLKYSERQYPHPLAVEAGAGGLRVYSPAAITANKDAIFGFMPERSGDDLILGHSSQEKFPDALVDGFSDWFVSARFAEGDKRLTVTYGHGSPFVYALYQGGSARITLGKPGQVWAGDEKSAVLGLTVNGKHYGLFGPSGSTWTGLKDKALVNQTGAGYFSLAVLPDANPKTLALFAEYAHAHVADSKVAWAFDPKTGAVTTTFSFTTKLYEGKQDQTLFALYPHQWRNAAGLKYLAEYPSVRGKMKLAAGTSFQTVMRYPGVLPVLPAVAGVDKQQLAAYLKPEILVNDAPPKDTYWDGKWLGKLTVLARTADQYGLGDTAKTLRDKIRLRLEEWLTATAADGKVKTKGLFAYESRWGTLIGYPASYGSDQELNDHHFHYGYFFQAAAEIAMHDPEWAKDDHFGGMVKLLIRDCASPDRQDKLFPFLRCFDPYAGHSWASGHAKFGDGNNQESSSEAMNAWSGLILWAEATGDTGLRDLGVYLFTTEMNAINEYWFDVTGENCPKTYTASVVTMVWGGKGANATWFSAEPAMVHGINWLPIHAGALYLGHHPGYVEKNYSALVKESGGTTWKVWSDLIWMYRALVDPADALKLFEAGKDKVRYEEGNSKAATYVWLTTLNELGQADASVTADAMLYGVFRKGAARTYAVYSLKDAPQTVTFSDGKVVKTTGKGFTLAKADAPAPKIGAAKKDDQGVLTHMVESEFQAGTTAIRVLAPDKLAEGKRYPAVYVLPVEAGVENRWGDALAEVKKLDLANKHQVICVFPTFSHLPWYCDHPTDRRIRQETYFVKVVVPFIERTYPAQSDARGRLLLGFSKSGNGAFTLLLRHPTLFGRAVAFDSPLNQAKPDNFGMGPIYGTPENFEKYRIPDLLRQHAAELGAEKRLAMVGHVSFPQHHHAIHELLDQLKISHHFRDEKKPRHHWDADWLAAAVEFLVK